MFNVVNRKLIKIDYTTRSARQIWVTRYENNLVSSTGEDIETSRACKHGVVMGNWENLC